MIRLPPRSTLDRSSAASDVYKRQGVHSDFVRGGIGRLEFDVLKEKPNKIVINYGMNDLSLIHISEPTRPY